MSKLLSIIALSLLCLNSFGQNSKQTDRIQIKTEFDILEKKYEESEALLKTNKNNIRIIFQGIASLQTNTNDSEIQKIIIETKKIIIN